MVQTLTISQMTSGGDFSLGMIAPTLLGGANVQANVQLQFSATGNTAQRPVSPATPTIRYNTDFEEFEFWDGTLWGQIGSSSDVAALIARLAANTAGNGASMIGLLNQGSVSGKTVQDLANADFIVKTNTTSLVNGFALSTLPTGFLSVATSTGNLSSLTFEGATNQITITNPTGSGGNPQFSIAPNPQLTGTADLLIPVGTTAQRPGSPLDGMIRYNTDNNVFEWYNGNALAWESAASTGGTVASVSGTLNRITSTGGTTPVIDIAATYVGQTSITTLGTIGTGTWQGSVIGATYGGTGVNNGSNTITLGGAISTAGALTLSGAFPAVFNFTGSTNVTFPTSGTLLTSAGAVTSIAGTANQIAASASTGAVTLSIANNPILPGTGGFTLPSGNTAARAGGAGTMRFNSQTTVFESTVDGTNWATIETSVTGVTSVSGTLNRITSTGGTTPVIDISASYVGQSSITTLGTITTGVWTGTNIALANGGTSASLTASNGGIVYSTGSAMAILAGTATASQVLLSGSSTTPAWSTATYPATTTASQILYSSSNNTITGLGTANNAVLATNGSGEPAFTGTLPSNVQVGVNSLNSGTSASSSTFWRGDGTWASPVGTVIPSGTQMLFVQTSAPTGWTKNTSSNNDSALRLVTGTPGTGGSVPFSTAFVSQSVTGTNSGYTLMIADIPGHTHSTIGHNTTFNLTTGVTGISSLDQTANTSGSTGGGGSHTHTFTGTAINLAVQYVDIIQASKN